MLLINCMIEIVFLVKILLSLIITMFTSVSVDSGLGVSELMKYKDDDDDTGLASLIILT